MMSRITIDLKKEMFKVIINGGTPRDAHIHDETETSSSDLNETTVRHRTIVLHDPTNPSDIVTMDVSRVHFEPGVDRPREPEPVERSLRDQLASPRRAWWKNFWLFSNSGDDGRVDDRRPEPTRYVKDRTKSEIEDEQIEMAETA